MSPAVMALAQLRKTLKGEIVERSYEDWSAFALVDAPSETEDSLRDELLLTDLDIAEQGGREIRGLPNARVEQAITQRAAWFTLTNAPQRLKYLRNSLNGNQHLLSPLVEDPLRAFPNEEAPDLKDWGYVTRFSPFVQSRDALIRDGMYSRIGKFRRSIICSAPMPDTIGSFDALWTSLVCHMLTVIPRNLNFADPDYQLLTSKLLLKACANLQLPEIDDAETVNFARDYYRRNICVALGVHEDSVTLFKKHFDQGVRCFRLYTIATDERLGLQVQRLTRQIRERFRIDDPIEFFVGQITSMAQVLDLQQRLKLEEWGCIDGLYIGNGGGVRCKTAETGMIVNTPELLLSLRKHASTRSKSIIVEGGVGDEPAVALLFGAAGLSYAAGVSGGCIEAPNGGLFLFDGQSYWSPQRGEASSSTKIIENSARVENSHWYEDGKPKQVEGEGGFIRQDPQFVSMCGRVRVRNEWLAQCFVKLGVRTIEQLQTLGTAFTRVELENVFDLDWGDLMRFGDVHLLPDKGLEGEPLYAIPMPARRRTAAMRSVASAIGSGEVGIAPTGGDQT